MFLLYLQKFADKSKKTMVRFRIFIYTLISILLYGCDSQPIPTSMPNKMGSIQSRGIIQETSLPVESEALFNISGGISLTNQIFTFDGTSWKPAEKLSYSVNSQESTLTAIYPAYNKDENKLIIENPYVDNSLEDILIAQKSFTDASNIELTFRHLFSLLTIHIESDLQEDVEAIAVTTPKVISMNGTDGTFTTSGEHTTTLSKDGTGDFSFIIPSINNCQLTITFNPGINEITHTLTHDFISGYKYECNVVDEDTRPGIKDADDLIDFSLLINGKSSLRNKSLSDFGETIDGRTVYRLLADITLTDEKSMLLLPIGYYEAKGFKDIFDGEGHTIFNLTIPDKSINDDIYLDFSGLFGSISKDGIVKNLNIQQAKTVNSPISTRTGVIASQNHGLIESCSVEESSFDKSIKIGAICGSLSSTGYIINSYTANNTFNIKSASTNGGIAGDANGYIINCYSYNNSYKNAVSGSYSGGIAGQSTTGKIHNCYIYQANIPNYWGSLLGLYNSGTIMRNFFYNNCKYIVFNIQQESSKNAQIYDSNFKVGETHISTLLNDWISTTGNKEFPATEYPYITFKEWKLGDDGSAVFQ